MSNRQYTPGPGNTPFGNTNTNPQASNYANDSIYSPTESNLIQKAIRYAIFDSAPQQFNALKLVFEKEMEEVNLDEFEYLEKTFGRTALVSTAIVAAAAASPGNVVTQTIPMNSNSVTHLSPSTIIVYPDNTKAVVKSISGLNVVVESYSNLGLSAVAVGDVFAQNFPGAADAMDHFDNYSRLETITRYNYVQLMLRARRWGRIELQKYINAGTTNYLESDKQEIMRQARTDMFTSFFNGLRGEFRIANDQPAKSMGGVFPTMVAAGSMSANPSLAGLNPAFEALALATNFKVEGATRFIYGTQEVLHDLSKVWKDPGVRYAPNDSIGSMDLKKYDFGGMNFVPVPCELFREQSCFPKSWARRLLVLDQETIAPVKMKGIPGVSMGETLDRGANGTRETFKDFWVEGLLSLRYNNPLGGFWIDVK